MSTVTDSNDNADGNANANVSDAKVREFEEVWANPPGIRGFFTSVQHKTVGARYMVTAFVFFLLGGILALLMRLQLAQPEAEVLGAQTYNELFTMHGTTMMFLFAVPFLEGLATYLLPLKLGARDMPFPRYNMFNYWCYLAGGVILYSSFIVGMVPDAGWFAYVPLSGPEFSDRAMDIWLFGLAFAEIAAIGAAFEIIVAILKTRAPGMSLDRMPIFAWTMLAVAFLILVAFVPLLVASGLLELDRAVGTGFFDHTVGGDPLLWQHLFWIFGHPEVYVMFLPGAAIVSHIVSVHSGRALVAYPLVVVAILVTAIMSLGLWVHHMYVVGFPPLTLSFFTASSMAITLASGLQVMAWLATLWAGRVRFTVPMLYAIGFLITFVAGGITGVMVASAPFDAQAHDSYFVVAHFHYVLIGGLLFPVFGALYHWWPKFTGRMTSPALGYTGFLLIFFGFHTTFLPMHWMGLWGMPRRVFTYGEYLELGDLNMLATIGAFVLAAGVLVLVVDLVRARIAGPKAHTDPWRADTLEWDVDHPIHDGNWPRIPAVAGRHPRWQERTEVYQPLQEAFHHHPSTYRATPLSSPLKGEPNGTARLPGNSVHPFLTAAGLVGIAVGILIEFYLVSLAAIVLLVGALAAWARRNEKETGIEQTRPIAGLPVEQLGPRSIAWWAGASGSSALIIGAVTVAFCSLYLQVGSSAWPPGPTFDQPWGSGVATVMATVALLVTGWCSRPRSGSGDLQRRTRRVGLLGIVAGLIGIVAIIGAWVNAGLTPSEHAYNSVVLVMSGVQVLALVFAVATSWLALQAGMLHRRARRGLVLLDCAAMLWATALLIQLIGWATTDLIPFWVI